MNWRCVLCKLPNNLRINRGPNAFAPPHRTPRQARTAAPPEVPYLFALPAGPSIEKRKKKTSWTPVCRIRKKIVLTEVWKTFDKTRRELRQSVFNMFERRSLSNDSRKRCRWPRTPSRSASLAYTIAQIVNAERPVWAAITAISVTQHSHSDMLSLARAPHARCTVHDARARPCTRT